MKRSLGWAVCALVLVVFGYFVWPTPWTYLVAGNGHMVVRVNRVTQRADILRERAGWTPLDEAPPANPFDSVAALTGASASP